MPLRETYYIGKDLESHDSESTAYEAGRSLAFLTWGISPLIG